MPGSHCISYKLSKPKKIWNRHIINAKSPQEIFAICNVRVTPQAVPAIFAFDATNVAAAVYHLANWVKKGFLWNKQPPSSEKKTFDELLDEARTPERMIDFKANEISLIAWSLGVLNRHDQDLFVKIALITRHKIANFNIQNLANTVSSFEKFQDYDLELLTAVKAAIPKRLENSSRFK